LPTRLHSGKSSELARNQCGSALFQPHFMKKSLVALLVTTVLITFARAESTVKLTGVHICCKSCVKGVDKAVGAVSGVTAVSDMDAETITLTAPDTATAQKAVDALVAAGFFGKSEDPAIKIQDGSGATATKVTALTVNDVHLCCGKCVKAVNAALGEVPGVTGNTAEKNAKSFEIKGDFSPKDVFTALQKSGLTGKVAN
jgi:copper chaperone CopZ